MVSSWTVGKRYFLMLPTEQENTHKTPCRQQAKLKKALIFTQSKLQQKHKPENFRLQ